MLGIRPQKTGTAFMIDKYFAHTLPGKPLVDWQPLEQHLKETAEKG
jgi:hypothetical protein